MRRALPGLGLAALGAAAGYGVHALLPGLPWLTASLILGVLVGCIPPLRPRLDGALKPGLTIASKRLLRIGIVVLGLKLSLSNIVALGWLAIVLIVALVGVSFVITWLIGKLFRLEGDQAVLMAAGFSICGVSAVGAMSAARRSAEKDTGTPVALVTLYGTLAIVVLPFLANILGLTDVQFGHWVGASVHDVGQVVATAQTAGAAALSVAIVVKLTRVLMLAPMVAIASIQTRSAGATSPSDSSSPSFPEPVEGPLANAPTSSPDPTSFPEPVEGPPAPTASPDPTSFPEPVEGAPANTPPSNPPIVPLFIVGFVVAVLIRSFVPLPDAVLAAADILQSALLAAALFGIGASLRLEQLARSGVRALGAGLVSWVVILGLALLVMYATAR